MKRVRDLVIVFFLAVVVFLVLVTLPGCQLLCNRFEGCTFNTKASLLDIPFIYPTTPTPTPRTTPLPYKVP